MTCWRLEIIVARDVDVAMRVLPDGIAAIGEEASSRFSICPTRAPSRVMSWRSSNTTFSSIMMREASVALFGRAFEDSGRAGVFSREIDGGVVAICVIWLGGGDAKHLSRWASSGDMGSITSSDAGIDALLAQGCSGRPGPLGDPDWLVFTLPSALFRAGTDHGIEELARRCPPVALGGTSLPAGVALRREDPIGCHVKDPPKIGVLQPVGLIDMMDGPGCSSSPSSGDRGPPRSI